MALVTANEAEPQPSVKFVSQNPFIGEFLNPYQDDLTKLNELDDEISAERRSWQGSDMIGRYADRLAEVFDQNNIPHALNNSNKRKKFIEQAYHDTYGDLDTTASDIAIVEKKYGISHLPMNIKRQITEVIEEQSEYHLDFKNAVKDLTDQKRAISSQLADNWQDYMVSGVDHFGSFIDFLQDRECEEIKIANKPFLQVLHGRSQSGSFLTDLRTQALNNAINNPNERYLDDFVRQLKGTQKGNNVNLLQWLHLLSYPSTDIDIHIIADKFKQTETIPKELKNALRSFMERPITSSAMKIRSLLSIYAPPKAPVFHVGHVNTMSRKGSLLSFNTEPKYTVSGHLEIPEQRPVYQLAFHEHGIPTIENREKYIDKVANHFAANDRRMREDISDMVNSLEEDPFGLGVSKLTSFEITAPNGNYRLPLRRYRPDKRIPLKHEEGSRIRVVYYLDRKGNPGTVFLREILSHEEFDRKYTS